MDRQRQALDRLKIISLGSCKGSNINSFKESGQGGQAWCNFFYK